jgi:hypothetical protein
VVHDASVYRSGGKLTGQLERVVLDFRSAELVARILYRSSLDGPNAGTKARAREVTELARAGLSDALEALEGRVDVVGTSGFTVREDLLCIATPVAPEVVHKEMRRGA